MLPYRTGLGYDIHRFAPDRPLILGGVPLPGEPGLDGHSDADCLTHAAADAILGALALPDIGAHFPPDDPACKDMDSQRILAFAAEKAAEAGYTIGNLSIMVLAERPRLRPHIEAMRKRLGATLALSTDRIGIQATTHEGLGALGRAEGIAALAQVLLWRGE